MTFFKGFVFLSILVLVWCTEDKASHREDGVGVDIKTANLTKSSSTPEMGPLHGLEEMDMKSHKNSAESSPVPAHESSMGMEVGGKAGSSSMESMSMEKDTEHDKMSKDPHPESVEPRANVSSISSKMPMEEEAPSNPPVKVLPSRFNQPLRPPQRPLTPPQSDESVHEHVERYHLHQAEDDSESQSAELPLKEQPGNKKQGFVSQANVRDSVVLASDPIPVRVGPNTRLSTNSFNRNSGNQVGIGANGVRRPLPILRRDQEQQQPPQPFNNDGDH